METDIALVPLREAQYGGAPIPEEPMSVRLTYDNQQRGPSS